MIDVSVIMPTYNTPYEYIKQSIESIINQTFRNFELIIIDDCSTKYNDFNFLDKYNDNRITLIKLPQNRGVAGALNAGLEKAQGKYILRMDADDIAIKERIELQYNYLEKHPDITLLGGFAQCFGDSKKIHSTYQNNEEIKCSFLTNSSLVHPTMMFRSDIYEKYKLKYDVNEKSEDYELWTRCAVNKNIKFAVLDKVLLYYRVHSNQVTKLNKSTLSYVGISVRQRYYENLGISLENEEYTLIFEFFLMRRKFNFKEYLQIDNICRKINDNVKQKNVFLNAVFNKVFYNLVCRKYIRMFLNGNLSAISLLWSSNFKNYISYLICAKKK